MLALLIKIHIVTSSCRTAIYQIILQQFSLKNAGRCKLFNKPEQEVHQSDDGKPVFIPGFADWFIDYDNLLNLVIQAYAAIAMISVGALAFGYLIMNIFSTSSNLSGDVCSTLFGSTSILTLTKREVWLCVVLSIAVVVIFVLFYNKIFAVTFDENFSKATGTKADSYNLLIPVVIAVIIVLAMNLVGSLLISALVIFPALSAMRLFRSFKQVTICSAVLSVVCAFTGIIISILAGTPVGSTIVAVDVAAFAICYMAGRITGGVQK